MPAAMNKLFYTPLPPPSPLSPPRLFGISPASNKALLKTLQADYEKWHVYFNDKGMHNHTAHQLLAIYQMGGSPEVIEAVYKTTARYMLPVRNPPQVITEQNFHEHLGEEIYYTAYRDFFAEVLLKKGAAATLEEYIFSAGANILPPADGASPMQMVSRFHAGIVHPLIHTGYGAEFGLLGIFAEGLAQTAVHNPEVPIFAPASASEYSTTSLAEAVPATVDGLTSLLPSLALNSSRGPSSNGHASHDVHALDIVARILNDPFFDQFSVGGPPTEGPPSPGDVGKLFVRALKVGAPKLSEVASAWIVDGNNPDEVARKIEEIIWMNTLIYGVCGWEWRHKGKKDSFNADFVTMHMVTSSLFLHSLVAYLSPKSKTIFLRTYFLNSLLLWLSRGRPAPQLKEFFSADGPTAAPVERNANITPTKRVLAPSNPSPNPWLPILQTALMHPDEHLCKVQRALAHFSTLYGTTERGTFKHIEGLPGAEEIDGTLFIRTAGLTADVLGWMREGEEMTFWDFAGYFN